MGRLCYAGICSLDGYLADREGSFAWAMPSEEVVAAVVELESTVGTHLYGRRTYELMTGWETDPSLAEGSPASADFARAWTAFDKVVYSSTLDEVTTSRTRLERSFDPAAVRELVRAAAADVAIAGPTLAAAAFAAGLVDEVQLFMLPVLVGGGLAAVSTEHRIALETLEVRSFDDGAVLQRYRVSGRGGPGARRP